jgi:TonB family protein
VPKNLRFWTNVGLIAFAHFAIIWGLIRWSGGDRDASAQSVMWLNGGGGDGIVAEKKNPVPTRSPVPRKESRTESLNLPESGDNRPFLASAPSEIQLPTPKPSPTATSTPAHTPKPKPKETPRATATPKPTPKAKTSPKPKKETVAKAKASAKPKPKAEEEQEVPRKSEVADTEKKKIVLAKNETADAKPTEKKSSASQTGIGKGTTAGNGGGHAGGSVNESEFGWYGSMLHDRFYSEWVQPTTLANAGAKNSVLVKLRIEKDGRVSAFEVVRPSGNSELDDSVKAIANRVTRVEPLPDGLGKGDHYDVKINFELNSE